MIMIFWTYYVAGSINPGFVEPREVTLTSPHLHTLDTPTNHNNKFDIRNSDEHIIDMSSNLLDASLSNAGASLGNSMPGLPDVYITPELIEAAKLSAGKYIR